MILIADRRLRLVIASLQNHSRPPRTLLIDSWAKECCRMGYHLISQVWTMFFTNKRNSHDACMKQKSETIVLSVLVSVGFV